MINELDTFIRQTNTVEEMYCAVCGTRCRVRRDVNGRDIFCCPHAEEGWHIHARRLVQKMRTTQSEQVHQSMQQDLDALLSQQGLQ